MRMYQNIGQIGLKILIPEKAVYLEAVLENFLNAE